MDRQWHDQFKYHIKKHRAGVNYKLNKIDPYKNKQLFLDDYVIEKLDSLDRILHQPERHGPVLTPDVSLGQTQTQTKSIPWWNPDLGLWEWWYWAMYDGIDHHNELPSKMYALEGRVSHYATSTDGFHWDTPEVGLYEFRGSKINNVAYDCSELDLILFHIIRDDIDPDPQKRYKGIFAKSSNLEDRLPGFSHNGFDWKYPDSKPIPSKDTSVFVHDQTNNQFIGTVKHGTEWGRSIWLSTSPDFIEWTDPKLVLHSDLIDSKNRKNRVASVVKDANYLSPPLVDDNDYLAEVYLMPVIPYEGIYIGFPMLFNPAGAIPPPHGNFTALNQTELTVSRNLHNWDRVANRSLFLDVLPWDEQTFETAQLSLCGPPIIRDNQLWIYYNASRYRGPRELYTEIEDQYFEQRGAVCLGKLRLDGFVSLNTQQSGSIVTKPFLAKGGVLHVNADVSQGNIKAEILDAESFQPINTLSLKNSNPFTGDHISKSLTWQEHDEIVSEKLVRIRFVIENGDIYSFWFERS